MPRPASKTSLLGSLIATAGPREGFAGRYHDRDFLEDAVFSDDGPAPARMDGCYRRGGERPLPWGAGIDHRLVDKERSWQPW